MKATNILLPLCLALAPCSALAQEGAAPVASPEKLAPIALETPEKLVAALPADQQAILAEKTGAFVSALEKCKAILTGVKDKETADAAAPQIQAVLDDVEKSLQCLEDDSMPEQLATLLETSIIVNMKKAQELDEMVVALSKLDPSFYGSDALADVFAVQVQMEEGSGSDVTPLTKEQEEVLCERIGKCKASLEAVTDLLLTVQDKESADATAPKLKAALAESITLWDALETWVDDQQIDGEAIDALIEDRFPDVQETGFELNKLVVRIADKEPPFYGSQALADVFESGDDGEDEEDGEDDAEAGDGSDIDDGGADTGEEE